MQTISERLWWKESVIYQIYPRSFKDSNGDGIGDLQGVIQKLDYLQDLGIDIIWLSPVYPSGNVDGGYDITDYRAIAPEFGTMADFEQLLQEIKKRDLRIIIDLVLNHSSDRHPWFLAAKQSQDNPYRNYYIWHEGKNGQPPNDWRSFFGGSAWTYNPETQDYYLHLFAPQQPDLNWEYEPLRQELYNIMRFWLDKGVDGFRLDVISLISKQTGFPPMGNKQGTLLQLYANGPKVHDYLQEMHREVLNKYDMMTVGEGSGVTSEQANLYVGRNRNELNMIFHFEHTGIDREAEDISKAASWNLDDMKNILTRWDSALGDDGWGSIYLGNHDLPRIVSKFGHDKEYRITSAKLLATLILTLRGTPYIYQGEEIGMTNCPFASMEEFRDIATINGYKAALEQGGDPDFLWEIENKISRDLSRTPMQWDSTDNASFTSGKPWIKVNPNYKEINVEQAISDQYSIFNYYKHLISLRKGMPVFVYGNYRLLEGFHVSVYAYLRTYKDEQVIVLLNFSGNKVNFEIPDAYLSNERKLIVSNYERETQEDSLILRPYEARVYRL